MEDLVIFRNVLQAVYSAHSQLAFDRRTQEEALRLKFAQDTLISLVSIEIRKEGLR